MRSPLVSVGPLRRGDSVGGKRDFRLVQDLYRQSGPGVMADIFNGGRWQPQPLRFLDDWIYLFRDRKLAGGWDQVPKAQALFGAGGKLQWKAWRRAKIKELGRRIIRLLDRLYGRQSLVPDMAIIPNEHFPFIADMEKNWRAILAELETILRDRERIPFLNEVSPDQARISHSEKWRAFFLFGLGDEVTGNTARCPKTAALLRKIPGLRSAWFSILAPNYRIKPHHGITKGIARAHLGLIVPKDWHKCRMVVGETGVHWREGKCFIFDDSMRHRVTNATNEERAILLFDFDRPMRWPSSALHPLAMWLLKRTAFFRDARRHFMTHEQTQTAERSRDQAIVDAMQSVAD